MTRMVKNRCRPLGVAATLLAVVAGSATRSSAAAQVPNADVRALGMGGNATALASGYSAVAWNPALLAFPNERITVGLGPVSADVRSGPVNWWDWQPFDSDTVPFGERERWLARVESEGAQEGGAGGEITPLAASVGHFAFQLSSVAHAGARLSPGAAELVLFGNVGRNGTLCSCSLAGSQLDGYAVSTAAVSAGLPITDLQVGQLSAGATLKYTVGHALVHGVDAGSTFGPNPTLDVTFPLVMTDTATSSIDIGSGVGIDLAVALRRPDFTLGASLKNVVQTFGWDVKLLRYREGRAILTRDTQFADVHDSPYASAPAELKRFVEDRTFAPELALGVALDPTERITLAGDLRSRLGSPGIDRTPAFHVGVGGEVRWSVLSVRAGGAVRGDGYQLSGGIGASLGPARIGTALLLRNGELGTDLVGMLTLFSAAF